MAEVTTPPDPKPAEPDKPARQIAWPPDHRARGMVTRPIAPVAKSASPAKVPATVSAATLAIENAGRKGLIVYNDSPSKLRIMFGAGASADDFTDVIDPGKSWYMLAPVFTGFVTGAWETAEGMARVTELA
jgi:hypothetical protein